MENQYIEVITDITNQQVKDIAGRIKNICGIVGSIIAEVFKKNLAKCVDTNMDTYTELEEVIFERV